MIKSIKLLANEPTLYKKYVTIINTIYNLNISKQQQYILAEILYQNNKYRDIEINERNILIFSTKIRKEMMERLGIEDCTFNNNISLFRKQSGLLGTILIGKNLNDKYALYLDKEINLNIKLILQNDKIIDIK